MPNTKVFIGDDAGPKVYKVGSIGVDTGSQDAAGDIYTATLKTERFSPAGEGGLNYFRRVSIRLLKSGSATIVGKVFVDDTQTQIYSGSTLTDQSVQFDLSSSALKEEVIEMDIKAVGTFIQAQLEIDSDDIGGLLLVESIAVHYIPVRSAKTRSAESQ